jgi:hypothetical protein
MKKMTPQPIRQGDVYLQPIAALPAGEAKEIREPGRVVLAHGEVTGHAHAIYDVIDRDRVRSESDSASADEMTEAAIARAQKSSKATCRLVEIKGDHFLEVFKPDGLKHEEHFLKDHSLARADGATILATGFYEVPIQVEFTVEKVRRVAD